jgi:uncharacterized membrane protein YfcA
MPRSLGPLQIGFFASAAIWFHFREKSLSWDWTLAFGTGVVAAASLALCLGYAVSVFLGFTRPDAFRAHLIVLSMVYFISSVVWLRQWEKRPRLWSAAARRRFLVGRVEDRRSPPESV